jgi:PAP2 superfamily
MAGDQKAGQGIAEVAWNGGGQPRSEWLKGRLATVLADCRSVLAALVLYAALDWIGHLSLGLTFAGWRRPMLAIALLLLSGLFYAVLRPCKPLAEAAFYAAFWIAFVILGAILTYFATAAGAHLPLMDTLCATFDAALAFDWTAWAQLVRSNPAVNLVLWGAYYSLLPQIVGSILLFAMARVNGRNEEFLLNAAVALLLTSLISALVPALGRNAVFAAEVQVIRQGDVSRFVLDQMQGVISFPSYHTVLALLCVYAHRGLRWSFAPVALLDCVMLISIPSEGGHYLADMIAGAMVALVSVVVVRWATVRAPLQHERPRSSGRLRGVAPQT